MSIYILTILLMFELKKKLKPLTEEEKSLVRTYFATGDLGGSTQSHIWSNYGRMRAHGERIPAAESYLDQDLQLKREDYKLSKEQEIVDGLRAYENEHQEASEYEVMKINEWENGRTLIIGIL